MSSCVIPGSFDPVTIGHLRLIEQAAAIFDRVTVTIMVNIRKKGTFPASMRKHFLEISLRHLNNVRVDQWDGLLADYMENSGETCLIRGIRSGTEADSEMISAAVNRNLNSRLITLLMPTDDSVSFVSSSMVRELIAFGGDPKPFLPPAAAEEICLALSNVNK